MEIKHVLNTANILQLEWNITFYGRAKTFSTEVKGTYETGFRFFQD